jgi:hypothetical protein
MAKSRLVFCAFFFLFAAVPAAAQLTGTWDGTMNVTVTCPGPPNLTWSSPVTLALIQSGDTFSGTLAIQSEADVVACQIEARFPIALPVSGNISGNSISGTVVVPDGSASFTGSVSGESMTLTVAGDGGDTRSLSLTRTSSAPPESGLTGTYEGTWGPAAFVGCCRLPPVSVGGTASGYLVQTGSTLTGALIIEGGKIDIDADGECLVIDVPATGGLVTAQVSGNTIVGELLAGEEPEPLNATVSGNTISGTIGRGECPGETPTPFTITRESSGPGPGPAPVISSFIATPSSIAAGESATLSWTTQHATAVSIDNGVGAQAVAGSITVRPAATTTYTLTASGPGGSATARATVTVAAAAAPRVVVGSAPAGFVQLAGTGGGTDSFTISNIGDAAATLTLSPAGNFFTLSATAVTLPPNSGRTVIITGTPQAAGSYDGSVSISGTGVPANLSVRVRMLSAAPPAGSVTPQATTARVEVASAPGQNASGSVEFRNSGSATLQGIAVADVPWIVPQSGVISIPAGQTASVTYTIDSAKRPDAGSPLGAAIGKLSLVFIPGTTANRISGTGAPSTATVSVTLVHLARPSVSPGAPPPLASGEMALFVAGLANRSNAVGDLLLANRQTTPLSNLQVFMQGSGAASQSTSLAQLAGNSSVALPGLIRNVFSPSVTAGTVQIRGVDTSRLSVAAIQSNTSSAEGTYGTALPVFRSDRGAGTGSPVVLSGLLKAGSVQTNVFVQELSGSAGSFRVEILDAAGNVIASRGPEPIAAFGFAELNDLVPPGAGNSEPRAARVTNTGAAGSRLNAYALVTNATNGDAWLVTDPAIDGPASDTVIVPIFSSGANGETLLFVTNRGTGAASVTVDVRAGSGRRRAVRRNSGTLAPGLTAVQTVTIDPGKTGLYPVEASSSGYARITAPAGAISAAGRSVRAGTSGNAHGSGLPAVPAGDALRSGQSRRFPGVDDASSASRAARVPGTYRTSLALVETAGQNAVVRVTLQFVVGGSLATSTARASKDYSLNGGGFRLISDLATEVVGDVRTTFGDLRNVTVDVEVVSGSGQVIPFLQSIESRSGDMIMRIE